MPREEVRRFDFAHGRTPTTQLRGLGAHPPIHCLRSSLPVLMKCLLYRNEFLSEAEEAELLRIFRGLEFAAYDYHEYLVKRRIAVIRLLS
jgi:hypothetical protein